MMKNLILILFISTFLFISCKKKTEPDTFNIGIEEVFQINETNYSPNNSLIFSITNINDSRCPEGAVCFWQGNADVELEIELPQKGSIILRTYNTKIDTFHNYSFELIDVSPHPSIKYTIELEDYEVTLIIRELN